MSRPQLAMLNRLCSKPETLTQAQILLHSAKLKTGSGSGYDLGQGSSGLPAICAYIASEQVGNNDVTKKVAQNASCLAPKIFESTLGVVRSALLADAQKESEAATKSRGNGKATYEDLVARFKWKQGEFMITCMEDVEQALVESRELRGRFSPPNDIVTVAVLCWVGAVLKVKKAHPAALKQEFSIGDADYAHVVEAIESTCELVKKDIEQKLKALRASMKEPKTALAKAATQPNLKMSTLKAVAQPASGPSTTRHVHSQPRSPAKSQSHPLLRSPSKSALKAASVEASPAKTPSHKRKVAFSQELNDDDDLEEPDTETPTRKKQKVSATASRPSPFPSLPSAKRLPALNLTPGQPSSASSSKVTLDDIPEGFHEAISATTAGIDMAVGPLNPVSTPAPSTPHRPRKSIQSQVPNTPSDYYGTPSNRRRRSRSQSQVDGDEEAALPRRCRPALLCHKQWYAPDPRLERGWRLAEVAKQGLIEKFGHPFEHLRQAAVEAGVV